MNYPYKKGWWETKDHRKLKIEDMKTSHIENTIKYLKKNIDFYDEGGGEVIDNIRYYLEDSANQMSEEASYTLMHFIKEVK